MWIARSPKRSRRISPAGLSSLVRSTIRISTIPSSRARFRSLDTWGRVTPRSSAMRFWVSPSS